MASKGHDLDQALLNPSAVFTSPKDVVASKDFTHEEKVRILRRWEHDARDLEVAEEENMATSQPDILDEILAALTQLHASHGDSQGAPTKQGGETLD